MIPSLFARSRRFLGLTVAIVGIAVVAVACVDASGGRNRDTATTVAGVTEVGVYDNYFDNPSIEVPAGTTVTWTWRGDADHNVVGGPLESPVQNSGEYQMTFNEAGTVEYECTLHPGMTGEVIVTQ